MVHVRNGARIGFTVSFALFRIGIFLCAVLMGVVSIARQKPIIRAASWPFLLTILVGSYRACVFVSAWRTGGWEGGVSNCHSSCFVSLPSFFHLPPPPSIVPVIDVHASGLLLLRRVGATAFYIDIILRASPEPTTALCTAHVWLPHSGFMLVFMSLLAKAYRYEQFLALPSFQTLPPSNLLISIGQLVSVN